MIVGEHLAIIIPGLFKRGAPQFVLQSWTACNLVTVQEN